MRSMEETVGHEIPPAFWQFLQESCRLRSGALRSLPGDLMPQPAQQLLVHDRDMTSTLATFHGSELRVQVLQCRELEGIYLREVFLRTQSTDQIVEYGVIAIALAQFDAAQQDAIRAGRMPLGGLLHHFKIRFASSPIRFFLVAADDLASTPMAALPRAIGYGRINRLARPHGAPLAWILEILPPPPP